LKPQLLSIVGVGAVSELGRDHSRPEESEAPGGVENELSGTVRGSSVQAGSIYGGVQFNFDSTVQMPVPDQLSPAPINFTDRQLELQRLQRLLDAQEAAAANRLIVISGVGGIGKTSLALRWLDETRERFPAGRLFTDLGGFGAVGPRDPGDVLGSFLRSLGVPPERVPLELAERAGLFRSLTAGRALAVLLDDAASAAQVRAVLPGTGPSLVVVTTRRLIAGLAIDGASFIELAPLDEDAAIELLDRVAGSGRASADPSGARSLVRLCGQLPIAVCASGARLAPRPRWAISRVVEELRDERQRLAALSRGSDISVIAVFDVSYRALPAEAARLYRLLGLWPGTEFGPGVAGAVAAVAPAKAADLLDSLVESSLLAEIADHRFKFHDLVRLHARDQAETEPLGERESAVARGVDWYLRAAVAADLVVLPGRWRLGPYYRDPPVPPVRLDGTAAAIEWLEAELDNLLTVLRHAADHAMYEIGWQLCEALWGLFLLRKHYDVWLESHRIGLACARACGDQRAEARMHNQLGSAYRSLRRYDDAIVEFNLALDLERATGHRLGEGSALDQLGVVYLRLGRYDDAIEHFARSRTIHQEGNQPRGVALMNLNIGHALSDAGRHAEAVEHLRTAYRQAGEIPEPYHQARALTILGQTYIRSGQPQQAVAPLDQALTVLDELNATHDQAIVHTHLATLARQRGDIAEARAHLERALARYSEVGAPQASDVRALLDVLTAGAQAPPNADDQPGS
jgi:tetratricopeptide (TPR) repeat protein